MNYVGTEYIINKQFGWGKFKETRGRRSKKTLDTH